MHVIACLNLSYSMLVKGILGGLSSPVAPFTNMV